MAKTRKFDIGWHVFRFHERFELADDQRFCRKGPLVYSRDYVSAADDESATYLQQLDALSRRQNGLELEGAWSRIRRAASSRSRAYRGWLLTASNCPMSATEIGRKVLFCDPRRATRILKTLAEIGLIEQARCPTFDLSENEAPKRKRRKKATKGSEKAKSAKRKSGRRNAVSRESSENLESSRSPLRVEKQNVRANQGKRNTGTPVKAREVATVPGPGRQQLRQDEPDGLPAVRLIRGSRRAVQPHQEERRVRHEMRSVLNDLIRQGLCIGGLRRARLTVLTPHLRFMIRPFFLPGLWSFATFWQRVALVLPVGKRQQAAPGAVRRHCPKGACTVLHKSSRPTSHIEGNLPSAHRQHVKQDFPAATLHA